MGDVPKVPGGLAISNKAKAGYQHDILTLLYLYLFVVLIFAISLVAVFWLKAIGKLDGLPWSVVSGFAVGSGGLGAGSLLFKKPLDRLFDS